LKFKEIESLLNKNNGILTIKEAEENGIYRGSIKYFTEKGKLEKVSRGVYVLPGIFEDEFFVVQNRFKKGIYSLETALYLHDLTDRTPSVFNMTFPKGYNLTNPKKNEIKCKSIKEDLYELGKEEIKTIKTKKEPAEHLSNEQVKVKLNKEIKEVEGTYTP